MEKYTEVRKELIRALRGKRTQGQVNQKLHFKGNQVYRWEAGTQSVGWKQFTVFCKICDVNLRTTLRVLLKFQGNPENSRELAKHLVGSVKISQFCEKMKLSRFKVSRWLSGKSDFTVDEVLELIEKSQNGLFDFVYHLTKGRGIPRFRKESEAKQKYAALQKLKPWCGIVRICLDLAEYQSLARHKPGFIAQKTGIDLKQEESLIESMVSAGALRWQSGKLKLNDLGTNMSGDHEISSARIAYWAQRASAIYAEHADRSKSRFELLIYTASNEGVQKIKEETANYYTRCRAILASDSQTTDRLQVLGIQLLDMDDFGNLSEMGK